MRIKYLIPVLPVLMMLAMDMLTGKPGLTSDLMDDIRPNILFIMSDDHGYQAIGSYGSVINQTPFAHQAGQAY